MGAVVGALLGATSNDNLVSSGTVAAGAGVALGSAGALLGLATSHGEKWETTLGRPALPRSPRRPAGAPPCAWPFVSKASRRSG